MPRLHLVRHGLSEANMDKSVNARKPDHAVELSEDGKAQASAAGVRLAQIIDGQPGFGRRNVRLYVSPYLRTRQTADGLEEMLRRHGLETSRKEYLALREISFGLYDGLTDDELATRFPTEHAHYAKHLEFEGGEFFAPMPMGESRIQVADRVRTAFGSILRDMDPARAEPITDAVIVAHGVTNRCFRLGWFNRPWEWYAAEPNPANCSITTITGAAGKGWREEQTFEGFAHVRDAQQRREEGEVRKEGDA